MPSIKTKYRSRLSIKSSIRLALTNTESNLEKLVSAKQIHKSHHFAALLLSLIHFVYTVGMCVCLPLHLRLWICEC